VAAEAQMNNDLRKLSAEVNYTAFFLLSYDYSILKCAYIRNKWK